MGYSNYGYQDTQGMVAKSFKVKVSPDDKMVTIINGNTILTTLSMKLNGNQLSLIGKNDVEISNVEIPNVNGVTNVSYDEIKKDLVVSLSSVDGTTKELRVSLRDLVDIYTAGDGINVEGKTIKIKINEAESYLTVNSDGLSVDLSGLTTKLDETFATDIDVASNTSKITEIEESKINKSDISISLPEDGTGVDTKVLSEKLVVAELNKKQNVGDYATKTELSAETNRATSAETELSEKLEEYKTSGTVTIEALGSPEGGAAKTYVVKQGGVKVGESINIPRDMVVQSGSIVKGTWDRDRTTFTPSEGGSDIALKLTIGNGSPVYVDVKQLVDAYTGKDGITVSDLNEISVKVNAEGNEYLSVDASGLKVSGVNAAITSKVADAINALDVADAAVSTDYVSSVSQTDGKIKVTRAKLPVVGDNTVSGKSDDDHIQVEVATAKGLVSNVSVTCKDIASAAMVEAISNGYFDKSNVAMSMPSDGAGVDTKVLSEKLIVTELKKKQDALVSGSNIKTVNGVSLLGNGNIDTPKTVVVNDLTTGGAEKALSAEQGKVLKGEVDGKQPKGEYALRAELVNKQEKLLHGAFSNKPVEPSVGEMYFCTDKQTQEGQTNGILIIWNGTKWTDMLGRAIN